MPAASDYVTGTISLTNGSSNFTGTSTGWLLAGFKEGDTIIDITGATEFMGVIATIDANGAGTLTKAWEGPTLVDVAYRMRYQPDGARVSAQARNLIELLGNGNVLALAGLSGSANQVPMFTGPGAMTLVPKTDLVSGAAYDVQVADLAARAAYDAQAEGYSVLVADTGDGRAAIYSKVSATSGDWSDPAYVTGPVGPAPVFAVTSTTTLDPGDDATFVVSPNVAEDGYDIEVGIPAGRGATPRGTYDAGTAYILDDAVLYNGSTFVALQATTGNAPPTLPTTSNAYWQLLARQGIDGAGTVNSVAAGAGISVDNTDPTAPEVSLADMAEATFKGREAGAGTGAPVDITPAQARSIITLPSAPTALNYLRRNAGNTAWEERTAAQVREDLGGFELIAVANPTASLNIEFLNLSAFRTLRLSYGLLPAAVANVGVQVSSDNGSSWLTSGSAYTHAGYFQSNGTITANGGAAIDYIELAGNATTDMLMIGTMLLTEFDKALRTNCRLTSANRVAAGRVTTDWAVEITGNTAWNALRVSSSQNLAGQITLEGVRG